MTVPRVMFERVVAFDGDLVLQARQRASCQCYWCDRLRGLQWSPLVLLLRRTTFFHTGTSKPAGVFCLLLVAVCHGLCQVTKTNCKNSRAA